ncbi:MAG: hypothetical protein KJ709_05715 [Nanoarchaeota archaeon]|nr:hypothetical protein [Nanoarchaeota archaeon]
MPTKDTMKLFGIILIVLGVPTVGIGALIEKFYPISLAWPIRIGLIAGSLGAIIVIFKLGSKPKNTLYQ